MRKASRATFILLFIFAPLAFGSVEPWAFFLLVLLMGACFLFYYFGRPSGDRFFYRVPGILPLMLLFALMVFQLIPLPDAVLELLSPQSLLYRRQTAGLFNQTMSWPISLDVRGGVYESARFLVCFGCYFLSIQILSDGKTLKRVVLILALFGGALALVSILQSIFTVDRVLWFREVPEKARPFGPYVCRNHYAGLMEMLFPLTLALVLIYRPPPQFGNRREKIIGLFEDDDFLVFILLCFSAVFMALSVFMTLSRGGIFSLCLSIVFFLLVLFLVRRPFQWPGRIKVTVVILSALVLAVSWFGWDRLDQRFGKIDITSEGRIDVGRQYWESIPRLIADFPVLGAGFGSFRNVIPKYHLSDPGGVVDHAHNDYLQLLAEGGGLGFLVFLAFFLLLFTSTFRTLKKRKEPYAVLVCAGATTGLVAIFCHSLVDFNLHINANTLYFSFLCALMVSTAHTRFRTHLVPTTYLKPYRPQIKRPVLIVFILLWIPLLIFSAGQWLADQYAAPYIDQTFSGKTDPSVLAQARGAAALASRIDPLNASYRILAGDIAFAAGEFSPSVKAYQQAVMRVPTRAAYLQKAGWATFFAGEDVEQADALMSAGIRFYPAQPALYGQYTAFLLKAGRQAAARDVVRKGLSLSPSKAAMFFTIMRSGGMTYAEMYAALTPHSYVWYAFASYIRNTDYAFMTREILAKAVNIAEQEQRPSPLVYLSLARFYIRENDVDDAITVLQQGIDKMPEHTGLLYTLAGCYERLQITYKAVELYKRILLMNPGHEDARARLANLTDR